MVIEKDWWVTVTLKALFQIECSYLLTFMGGASLSEGFKIAKITLGRNGIRIR